MGGREKQTQVERVSGHLHPTPSAKAAVSSTASPSGFSCMISSGESICS